MIDRGLVCRTTLSGRDAEMRPRTIINLGAIACWLAMGLAALNVQAWVYPEHRDLALLAVKGLDPDRSLVFSQLWREARLDHQTRFCEQGADQDQGLTPDCIDWAALSAIAGDHSCSSAQMLTTVKESDWILANAQALEESGAFGLVLEKIPSALARQSRGE